MSSYIFHDHPYASRPMGEVDGINTEANNVNSDEEDREPDQGDAKAGNGSTAAGHQQGVFQLAEILMSLKQTNQGLPGDYQRAQVCSEKLPVRAVRPKDTFTEFRITSDTSVKQSKRNRSSAKLVEDLSDKSNISPKRVHINVNTNRSAAEHPRNVPQRTFQCHVCKADFSNLAMLDLHKANMLPNLYQCTVCKMTFDKFAAFEHHKPIHAGGNPCRCVICWESLQRWADLKRRNSELSENFSRFFCMYCCRSFKTAEESSEHESRHFLTACPTTSVASATPSKQNSDSVEWTKEKSHDSDISSRMVCENVDINHSAAEHAQNVPPETFQCSVCKAKFPDLAELNRHETAYRLPTLYQCTECKKTFDKFAAFEHHEPIHSGGDLCHCVICKKSVQRWAELKQHKSELSKKFAGFLCMYCCRSFKTAEESSEHGSRHFITECPATSVASATRSKQNRDSVEWAKDKSHDSNISSRKVCENVDINQSAAEHAQNVPPETFQCSVCKAKFPNVAKLNRHKTTYRLPNLYQCTKCKMTFDKLDAFEHHKSIHSGGKPCYCGICRESLQRWAKLKLRESQLLDNSGGFYCLYCCRSFKTDKELSKHDREHFFTECPITSDVPVTQSKQNSGSVKPKNDMSDKPNISSRKVCENVDINQSAAGQTQKVPPKSHQCRVCKTKFPDLAMLNRHRAPHKLPNLYQCTVCKMTFYKYDALEHHESVHKGGKPCHCVICKAASESWAKLKRRESELSDESGFFCVYCCRSYTTAGGLAKHKREHFSRKLFQCNICFKSFMTPSRLGMHVSLVHAYSEFTRCDKCNKGFKYTRGLKRHIKLVHSAVPSVL